MVPVFYDAIKAGSQQTTCLLAFDRPILALTDQPRVYVRQRVNYFNYLTTAVVVTE